MENQLHLLLDYYLYEIFRTFRGGLVLGNMSFKKLAVFLLVAFNLISAYGQDPQIDSLKTVIESSGEDTIKVNALNNLSLLIWDSQPNMAITYANEARALGNKIKYKKGVALALKNIGLGYYTKSDYINVLENWQRSLAIYDSLGDYNGVSNLLNNIGSVYVNQGDDAKAIDYYLRALKVGDDSHDSLRIASAWVNLGNLYLRKVETHDKALEYLQKALSYSKVLNDLEIIGNAYLNIGEIYLLKEKYDSALIYFENSLKTSETDGSGNVPYSLNSIGKVYQKLGNYQEAINYHEQALQLSKQMKDNLQIAQSYIGLGNTYNQSKKYRLSIQSFKEAEPYVLENQVLKELKEIYEGISTAYSAINDFSNAFKYQTLLTEINLKLYNAENDKKLERLQFGYDLEKKQDEIDILAKTAEIEQLKAKRQEAISWGFGIVGLLILAMAVLLFQRFKFVKKTNKIIEAEKDRSENLLLNILPHETAEELKIHGEAKARSYEMVSILFTDFKGFTALSATLSPEELVKEIHHCYKAFDEIVTRHGVEKIKTIGDAYMAAGGLPVSNETHALDVLRVAMEIREFMANLKAERQQKNQPFFEIRIGIHSGPVVAGIVGTKKFAYDIWGDTVNIASRMESNGVPGKVNISGTTYELIKDQFTCTPRGAINVKGGGDKIMYFVEEEVSQLAEMG